MDELLNNKLFAAAKSGTPEEIIDLLNCGAQVNATNLRGDTPLMLALSCNQKIEHITALLSAGAEVARANLHGETALHLAAKHNSNPELIVKLLQAGADIKALSDLGQSALMLAAKYNPKASIIAQLRRSGADILSTDVKGRSPLILAARHNTSSEVITELLLQGAQVNKGYENSEGEWLTELMEAAKYNSNPQVITALVKGGSDINAVFDNGCSFSALMWAAVYNSSLEVITELLHSGAQLKARNFHIKKVYSLIKNSRVKDLLIKAGVLLFPPVLKSENLTTPKENYNITPLIWVAENCDNPKIISQVIEVGAQVNLAKEVQALNTYIDAYDNLNNEVLEKFITTKRKREPTGQEAKESSKTDNSQE